MGKKIKSLLQKLVDSIPVDNQSISFLKSSIGRLGSSMDPEVKLFNKYIAQSRVIYIIHQTGHWISRGPHFYGAHEMFTEMYESAQTRADEAAERALGIYGPDSVSHALQTYYITSMLKKYDIECPFENSLLAEKDFIEMNRYTIEKLESLGKMTAGLEDMLPAHASMAEKSIYFLQQSLSQVYTESTP